LTDARVGFVSIIFLTLLMLLLLLLLMVIPGYKYRPCVRHVDTSTTHLYVQQLVKQQRQIAVGTRKRACYFWSTLGLSAPRLPSLLLRPFSAAAAAASAAAVGVAAAAVCRQGGSL